LGQLDTVELIGPDNDRWLVRAPNSRVLADAFATAGRPPGRLRIEVDPLRI
jgi:primosomal protein N' (replication factor Y)